MASNPVVRFVADALRFYMEFHAAYDGFYGAFIHDPLAVAAALDRTLVTTEALYVDVETRGEITAGMTVADRRHLTGRPAEPRRRRHRRRRDVPGPPGRTRRTGWRRTTRTWHARRAAAPATFVAVWDEEDGMNLSWLQVCAEGQTADCVAPIQVAYLVALVIGAVLLAIIGRRSRDFTTSVLSLMAVAIAINIAVGSIIYALRLPIYLDSIGTVLVGALAAPWAGALTGILSNLIWSILPIPGGASPTAAFFAPVAGVIGLMAGFWASRGVFQFRSDDARAGGFLSLAAGFAAAFIVLQIVQSTIGLAIDPADPNSQNRFVVIGVLIVLAGVAVAWLTGRTVFDLKARRSADPDLPHRRDGDLGVRPGRRRCSGWRSGRPATSRRSTARIPTAMGRSARCSGAPT